MRKKCNILYRFDAGVLEVNRSFDGYLVFTLSVIGYGEIGLSIDGKGLPVSSTVGLQRLELHKLFSSLAPLVNHREVSLRLFVKMIVWPSTRVRHHQKYLHQTTKQREYGFKAYIETTVISPILFLLLLLFCHTFFPMLKCLQTRAS